MFEPVEYRTCVQHLYNNFSATYKGLVLKNLLWLAGRATTEAAWVTWMNIMCDLDPAAYGWFQLKLVEH